MKFITRGVAKLGNLGWPIKLLLGLLLVVGLAAGYVYAVSPASIRQPLDEHYHFRMQIIVDGKAVNFADKQFQIGYAKDQCSTLLPKQPIHFHDNKDQMVHIHWEGITGGMVMKYYGWNYIAGLHDALGYRVEDIKQPTKVKIHGYVLPEVPQKAKFYIYTGDEKSYKSRDFEDWKFQDLEEFFGKSSNFPGSQARDRSSLIKDLLFTKAAAHGTDTEHANHDGESSEQMLTRINNLLGNVVIFVQPDKPTDKQIKARFDALLPLSDSTCGG